MTLKRKLATFLLLNGMVLISCGRYSGEENRNGESSFSFQFPEDSDSTPRFAAEGTKAKHYISLKAKNTLTPDEHKPTREAFSSISLSATPNSSEAPASSPFPISLKPNVEYDLTAYVVTVDSNRWYKSLYKYQNPNYKLAPKEHNTIQTLSLDVVPNTERVTIKTRFSGTKDFYIKYKALNDAFSYRLKDSGEYGKEIHILTKDRKGFICLCASNGNNVITEAYDSNFDKYTNNFWSWPFCKQYELSGLSSTIDIESSDCPGSICMSSDRCNTDY